MKSKIFVSFLLMFFLQGLAFNKVIGSEEETGGLFICLESIQDFKEKKKVNFKINLEQTRKENELTEEDETYMKEVVKEIQYMNDIRHDISKPFSGKILFKIELNRGSVRTALAILTILKEKNN